MLNLCKSKFSPSVGIGLVLLAAVALRLSGFYHGVAFHNDESSVLSDAAAIKWDSLEPRSFVYGGLTYYIPAIGGALARLFGVELSNYEHWSTVGRLCSALIGVLGVLGVALLAQALFSKLEVTLLSVFFIAVNPLHIQLSHFYSPDILLSTLITWTLLACALSLRRSKRLYLVGAALCCGAAMATKISGVALIPVVLFCCLLLALRAESAGIRARLVTGAISLVAMGLACVVLQPFTFLHFDKFLFDVGGQIEMVRGDGLTTWNFQYANTPAYIYPLQQIFFYAMGPLVTSLALLGITVGLAQAWSTRSCLLLIPLVWACPYFLITGGSVVKFLRYYLPLMPILSLYAGYGLAKLTGFEFNKHAKAWMIAAMLTLAALHGVGISLLYRRPHSFQVASHWICQHIPQGATILQIPWDTNLPRCSDLPEVPQYNMDPAALELPFYWENDQKDPVPNILELLEKGDYLVIPTPRIIRSLLPVERLYPDANRILQLIFSGHLGYSLERSFTVYPAVGPIKFDDSLADESFTVHDRPRVLLFKNEKKFSQLKLRQVFDSRDDINPRLELSEMLKIERE